MPSFDVVSKTDMQEVRNAVDAARKEIGQRFDFKGSKCEIQLEEDALTLLADDDFKRKQVVEVLETKLVRRKVDLKSLDYEKVEAAAGSTVRQHVKIVQGVGDIAKQIVKDIKATQLKVQAAIQGDTVRVSGKKRDDLQAVIAALKDKDYGIPLQYENYRD